MGKSLRDHIEDSLENIPECSLKKFKRKLNDAEVEPGYNRIPRGPLERADTMDIADKIISYYREEYGLRLTLSILEAINEKDEAARLREKTGTGDPSGSSVSTQVPIPGGSRPGTGAEPMHFVDTHRLAIISRTPTVDPILDQLLALNLITEAQYDAVRAKDTSQNKMRELYCYIRAWGKIHKDQFYGVLKAENGPLIADLGGL